jgi:RNA polymerase sigma factor (sigma-70 family)
MPGSYRTLSLEDLQRLFGSGDAEALAELVRRYEPDLRACARRAAGGHEAVAEDGYGELSLKLAVVVRKSPGEAGTYDPSQPFLPWARTLLRNAVADQLRKWRARERPLVEEPNGSRKGSSDVQDHLAREIAELFAPLLPATAALVQGRATAAGVHPGSLSVETREQIESFRAVLRKCVQKLSEAQRQLIANRYWGVKRSHEYAGISPAAIRQRLHHALEALRECVSGSTGGG